MKKLKTMLILSLISSFLFSQRPTSIIEGVLEVYDSLDTTSTYIGNLSGQKVIPTNDMFNTFVGSISGKSNTTGKNNTFFGSSSGTANTEGGKNSFYGAGSGLKILNGEQNTLLGYTSGRDLTSGESNTLIGSGAGILLKTGSLNVLLGHRSGDDILAGDKNTFLGEQAGTNIAGGSNNVFIGYSVGPMVTSDVSKRLYLDIEKTNEPLLYGEFDNNIVRINGDLFVTGSINPTSDFDAKELFRSVDHQRILELVSNMGIEEWQYKGLNKARHIGPIAQEFYNAFGLGNGETSIATVDADGVALAAIKALNEKNKELERIIKTLLLRVEVLEKK